MEMRGVQCSAGVDDEPRVPRGVGQERALRCPARGVKDPVSSPDTEEQRTGAEFGRGGRCGSARESRRRMREGRMHTLGPCRQGGAQAPRGAMCNQSTVHTIAARRHHAACWSPWGGPQRPRPPMPTPRPVPPARTVCAAGLSRRAASESRAPRAPASCGLTGWALLPRLPVQALVQRFLQVRDVQQRGEKLNALRLSRADRRVRIPAGMGRAVGRQGRVERSRR